VKTIPQWHNTGKARPAFAQAPGPGQESVWDYPRPPVVAADERRVRVTFDGRQIAASSRALRVLETASPPTFYLPEDDIDMSLLALAPGASWCEWKGDARYWRLRLEGAPSSPVAWDYPAPNAAFAAIARHVAFYPGAVVCTVAGERVRPQPGGFYGGWMTDEIVGPVKGEPGTAGW
jgi:uncharacterized protein (DUF427 family)